MEFDVSPYREIDLSLKELFPRYRKFTLQSHFDSLKDTNPHQTILNVLFYMADFGYNQILDNYGFHQEEYYTFKNHAHQCTPALALVLKQLGFHHVHYLECYRIETAAFNQGFLKMVDPSKEPNPKNRQEFIKIGRIPYCLLEVEINKEKFYISGKHISLRDNQPSILLKPICFREMIGILPHPQDTTKSGVYLQPIKSTIPKIDPEQVIWLKQTYRDQEPELFATFLRMNLQE